MEKINQYCESCNSEKPFSITEPNSLERRIIQEEECQPVAILPATTVYKCDTCGYRCFGEKQ